MVTPAKDGKLNPDIIAAAEIAGVDRIFRIGGAQAVAALAYGTESIPRVDKIVGPGNAFVAEAKKQVFGQVSIDMIAGPSEILVIADGNSDAEIIAADLLSQAEHDKMASAVLVTESEALAQAVTAELERQIALLPRAEIARVSIDNNGKIILVKDIAEAIAVSMKLHRSIWRFRWMSRFVIWRISVMPARFSLEETHQKPWGIISQGRTIPCRQAVRRGFPLPWAWMIL